MDPTIQSEPGGSPLASTNTTTPIAEQSAEVSRRSAQRLPTEVSDAFRTELGQLVTDGIPSGVAAPGSPMPDGELLVDADGTMRWIDVHPAARHHTSGRRTRLPRLRSPRSASASPPRPG